MYEIVLADGSVKRCSATEDADLFRAIPWSHGTLGFLVGVEVKIIPAKPWVELEYFPVHNKEQAVALCQEKFAGTDEFVEALVFAKNQWVVMTGKMVDQPAANGNINRIGQFYKPWFFTHVAKYLQRRGGTEYIPLRDYYHRHTRSLFWEIQDIITFGNQWWFRYLFGWMMPPHIALMKRTQTEELRRLYELHHVVQDMLVPASKLNESLTVIEQEFDVYPLWICPMRIFPEDAGFVHPTRSQEEMFVDVGVYGVPKSPTFLATPSTRAVEDFVRQVEGFQMLYADMYQVCVHMRLLFFVHPFLLSVCVYAWGGMVSLFVCPPFGANPRFTWLTASCVHLVCSHALVSL